MNDDEAKRCAENAIMAFAQLDGIIADAADHTNMLIREIASADAGAAFAETVPVFSSCERRALVLISSLRRIVKLIGSPPIPIDADEELPAIFQKNYEQMLALLEHFAADLKRHLEFMRVHPEEAPRFSASARTIRSLMVPILEISGDQAELASLVRPAAISERELRYSHGR